MKTLKIFLYTHFLYFVTPLLLFAYGDTDLRGPAGIKNPLKSNTIMELLNAILDIFIRIGTPLIVLAFIYVGFRFVEARGNATKIEDAKKALLYTVIGTAVLLGAKAISMLLQNTVNLF